MMTEKELLDRSKLRDTIWCPQYTQNVVSKIGELQLQIAMLDYDVVMITWLILSRTDLLKFNET